MKTGKNKPTKRSASGRFVLGRERFAKINAVEGIARTPAMKEREKEFDRQGLKRSPSPSIAADNSNGGRSLDDFAPTGKRAPLAWPRSAARQSEAPQPAPLVPHEPTQRPTEFRRGPAPEPGFARTLHRLDDRAPLAAMPRADDRRSVVTRAMGVAATIFSLVALVAVSALLVLLAVGGEWTAPAVTGTEAKLDESRIPSQGYTARAGGTVRAVDPQEATAQMPQAAGPLPAENPPVAGMSVESQPSPDAFAARSVFSPPAAEQASAASQGFEPINSSAAPAAEESAAPAQAAATETGDSAKPAPETRSAPVTSEVNMRAGPENDAAVVAVVPAKQNVEVVACTRWCEVVYDGRQGFIHRRFVSGAER